VKNESVIQEATLACDELEEGFPQDRLVQTILSGNYKPKLSDSSQQTTNEIGV
jgi:hypothetical protein